MAAHSSVLAWEIPWMATVQRIVKSWTRLRDWAQGFEQLREAHLLLFVVSSVQFSHSVVSHSLRLHESQHARPPCPSPTPGVYANSCPSSWLCNPAISSSVIPFSCPQPLLASESFPMSQLFAWGVQRTGVSALTSVFPMNTQDWFPLGWTGWISL